MYHPSPAASFLSIRVTQSAMLRSCKSGHWHTLHVVVPSKGGYGGGKDGGVKGTHLMNQPEVMGVQAVALR